MELEFIKLLKDRPIVVPRILINNYRLMKITDSELIILLILHSYGDKILYDPEKFSKEINCDKHEVMNLINNLIEKNIISLVIEKENRRTNEYLSLELLYEKMFNILIDNDSKESKEIDNSIFNTFESELGRTLSSFEYEQIKEWITSGNNNEIILLALKEAVMNGVGNLRYIDTVLYEWKKKGFKNKNDIERDRENRRSKKNKEDVYDMDWLNEE